jgi:hypothetical protein
MNLQLDSDDLRPLVEAVLEVALEKLETDRAQFDRLAYSEVEAAELIGVRPHVLRDCRRRGEIEGVRVGKRIQYARDELLNFLDRNKLNGSK